MRTEIQDWARIDARPHGEDLKGLYRDIVCPMCSDMALFAMSEQAMVKGICIAVYMAYLNRLANHRIVSVLAKAFGVSEWTIDKWLPSRKGNIKYVNVRQIDRAGRAVAKFESIKEASRETGIGKDLIYRAITNGYRASGFRFVADTSLPVFQK